MKKRIFVDGQEGTTGLKIFEYLSQRDDIEIMRIEESRRKEIDARREIINASDITFLCLPDQASREAVSLTENPKTILIDASTAFRTHPDWAYGLPELKPDQRKRIQNSQRIAVPGCHASAFLLGIRPLSEAQLLPKDFIANSYSITGYSGGGKSMIQEYEQTPRPQLNSPRPYALGLHHKHIPEMMTHAKLKHSPIFTPIVGPFYQGLSVTTFFSAHQLTKKIHPKAVQEILTKYYANEHFIRVMPFNSESSLDHGFLDVQANNGTNRVDIFVFGYDDQFVIMTRLDNLGKGASGAAIQCLNLVMNAAENTGLAI